MTSVLLTKGRPAMGGLPLLARAGRGRRSMAPHGAALSMRTVKYATGAPSLERERLTITSRIIAFDYRVNLAG